MLLYSYKVFEYGTNLIFWSNANTAEWSLIGFLTYSNVLVLNVRVQFDLGTTKAAHTRAAVCVCVANNRFDMKVWTSPRRSVSHRACVPRNCTSQFRSFFFVLNHFVYNKHDA